MYLISDNLDTYTGMKLAGVDGVVVHEKEELRKELTAAAKNPQIGIILITEKFSKEYADIVDEVKLNTSLPLIIDIPDRHGTSRRPDFITAYVNEAIGLKL